MSISLVISPVWLDGHRTYPRAGRAWSSVYVSRVKLVMIPQESDIIAYFSGLGFCNRECMNWWCACWWGAREHTLRVPSLRPHTIFSYFSERDVAYQSSCRDWFRGPSDSNCVWPSLVRRHAFFFLLTMPYPLPRAFTVEEIVWRLIIHQAVLLSWAIYWVHEDPIPNIENHLWLSWRWIAFI